MQTSSQPLKLRALVRVAAFLAMAVMTVTMGAAPDTPGDWKNDYRTYAASAFLIIASQQALSLGRIPPFLRNLIGLALLGASVWVIFGMYLNVILNPARFTP